MINGSEFFALHYKLGARTRPGCSHRQLKETMKIETILTSRRQKCVILCDNVLHGVKGGAEVVAFHAVPCIPVPANGAVSTYSQSAG